MTNELAEGLFVHSKRAIGASGNWLVERLTQESLTLDPANPLAVGLKDLSRLRELALVDGAVNLSFEESHRFFSQAFGTDFLTKAIHQGQAVGLQIPRERWKYLTLGNPLITMAGLSSKPRNLTWETVIASLARTFCNSVHFEEPDIICDFKGKKIAVAAKMAYSEKNVIENFRDGFRQAKSSESDHQADAILVFLNVVDTFPMRELFEISSKTRYEKGEDLRDEVMSKFTQWCERFNLRHEAKRLGVRSNKPVGVAFFAPFMLTLNGNPLSFFYTHTPIVWSEDSLDYQIATAFLQACNGVLGFMSKECQSF